jgi:hypothetical protein
MMVEKATYQLAIEDSAPLAPPVFVLTDHECGSVHRATPCDPSNGDL